MHTAVGFLHTVRRRSYHRECTSNVSNTDVWMSTNQRYKPGGLGRRKPGDWPGHPQPRAVSHNQHGQLLMHTSEGSIHPVRRRSYHRVCTSNVSNTDVWMWIISTTKGINLRVWGGGRLVFITTLTNEQKPSHTADYRNHACNILKL